VRPTIRSLCSGYGGLEMAVEHVTDGVLVDHAETDKRAAMVHDAHWPGVPNIGDITTIDWSMLEPTDILCAGFPCQPISVAGQRKVTNDARWLWPHIAHAVRVLRPRHVVLENVPPLLRLWRDDDGRWNRAPVEEVAGDLAAVGYVGSWRSLRAADIGAPHERERVFIVASDTQRLGLEGRRGLRRAPREGEAGAHHQGVADAGSGRLQAGPGIGHLAPEGDLQAMDDPDRLGVRDWGAFAAAIRRWERLTRPAPEPSDEKGRLAPAFVEWMMGLPAGWVTDVGLSHTAQLHVLGNGVVPQQAFAALNDLFRERGAA